MLGIVAAFKEETAHYASRGRFREVERSGQFRFYRARRGPSAVLVTGAVGKQAATEATLRLIENYGPRLVVSAGFAGAARPSLSTGDVFVCDRVVSMDGPPAFWTVDNANERLLRFGSSGSNGHNGHNGNNGHIGCVSVSQFLQVGSMKSWLGKVLSVGVVDQESYWVTEVAASHGLPQAVVRAVLHPLEDDMPDFLVDALRPGAGSPKMRALRYGLRHPHRVRRLLRLSAQVKLAGQSLADCLESEPWK